MPSTPSITVSTVQMDGLTVRVRTLDPGDGHDAERPPYVLVHGLGMTHRYLDRLADRLSSDAVVHSIDLPGFGYDPRPREQLDVEDHGALIVGALTALGLRRCTLVGHSMGAQFVTAAALQAPELVDGVVLLGPVVDRLRRTVVQQAVSLLHDTFRESPRANLIVYTDYLRTGMRWYLRQLMPMMKYPLERAVERLTCPVLVLRGGRDLWPDGAGAASSRTVQPTAPSWRSRVRRTSSSCRRRYPWRRRSPLSVVVSRPQLTDSCRKLRSEHRETLNIALHSGSTAAYTRSS